MEARLGADFSGVRIHSDSAARSSAAALGARAYTSGEHVVIGDGGAHKQSLAHELVHVLQQRSGPVAGTDNGAGLTLSDPADRFERDADFVGRQVAFHAGPTSVPRGEGVGGGAPTVRTTGSRAPDADLQRNKAGGPISRASSVKASSLDPPVTRSRTPIQRWYQGQTLPTLYDNRLVHSEINGRVSRTQEEEHRVAAFVSSMTRRPRWYQDEDTGAGTRQHLLQTSEHRTFIDPFTDAYTHIWRCADCGRGVTEAGIDIGHNVAWKTYLQGKGVRDNAEATAAYNDLENLKIECASCNRSHDWETNANGEYESETDEEDHLEESQMEEDEEKEPGPTSSPFKNWISWQFNGRDHGPDPGW
jgi:Domain of unknown function (DUF4157)/HNH/ENDO VII superfamily nuclease with conserved GHE residues